MTKSKSLKSSEKNNTILISTQKFSLSNPPSIHTSSFIIEQDFLRHIKDGHIPNLKQYLEKLNCHDWTCLLAYNPRPEFLDHLDNKMIPAINWKYIIKCIINS